MRRADVRPAFAVLLAATLCVVGCGKPMQHVADVKGEYMNYLLVSGDTVFAATSGNTSSMPVSGGTWTLLSDDHGPLAADETDLYISGGKGLWRVPLAGGAPEQLVTQPDAGVSLDAQNVYFSQQLYDTGNGLALMRKPKAGGDAVMLVGNLPRLHAFLAAGGFLFFVVDDQDSPPGYVLKKVPVTGGPAEVVMKEDGQATSTLAADATNLYFDFDLSNVMRVPLAGGQPEKVAKLKTSGLIGLIFSIATDGTHVYVLGGSTDPYVESYDPHTFLSRVPVAGGELEALTDEMSMFPGGLSLSKDRVFFGMEFAIYSVPK